MNSVFNRNMSRFNWTNVRSTLSKMLRRPECDAKQTSTSEIELLLKKRFPLAKDIQVQDTSGGCGAMFTILVESKEFQNLSVLKQHKIIYQTLSEQIKLMHGLHIVTKVPK